MKFVACLCSVTVNESVETASSGWSKFIMILSVPQPQSYPVIVISYAPVITSLPATEDFFSAPHPAIGNINAHARIILKVLFIQIPSCS